MKSPDEPNLNSIKSVALIDSVNPSNLTAAATGVAGRRGRIIFVGSEAGSPFAALVRILIVTSLRAVAEGIRFDMLNESEVMAVHLVPLVLNSMRFETPVIVSLRVLSVKPDGDVVDAAGTATSLMFDEGADAVALVLTITVTASLPIALRVMFLAVAGIQVVPLLRLYSIEVVTPVIMSIEPLYAALGGADRDRTDTARVADAKLMSVALMRT